MSNSYTSNIFIYSYQTHLLFTYYLFIGHFNITWCSSDGVGRIIEVTLHYTGSS